MVAGERVHGLQDRVAGAKRRVLDDGGVGCGRLGRRRHAGADHDHDALGLQARDVAQDMGQHGPAGHRVQHLGPVRFHAGPGPGGQNDDGEAMAAHERQVQVNHG